MLSSQEVEEIKSLSQQYPAVSRLYDAFVMYDESPYVESYLSVRGMIDHWRKELDENRVEFNIKDTEDKKFERAFIVVKGMAELIEKLDEIRQKMTPEQKLEADKKSRAKKLEDKIAI